MLTQEQEQVIINSMPSKVRKVGTIWRVSTYYDVYRDKYTHNYALKTGPDTKDIRIFNSADDAIAAAILMSIDWYLEAIRVPSRTIGLYDSLALHASNL